MTSLNDPHPTWTLEHAKNWLRERFYAGEATPCPCCHQTVKLYARKIGPSMASALLTLYRHAGTEYASIIDLWSRLEQADGPKLRYWGLIEPHKTEARPSGEVGVYRVTDLGVRWITGHTVVKSRAKVFNSRCYGLDGPDITFTKALKGKPFDLAELMAERPYQPPDTDPTPQLFPEDF